MNCLIEILNSKQWIIWKYDELIVNIKIVLCSIRAICGHYETLDTNIADKKRS